MAASKVYEQYMLERVWRKGPSHTAGRSVNWCSEYRDQYGGSLEIKTEPAYDPAIPLLGT